MAQVAPFRLRLPAELGAADRQLLVTALEADAEVQTPADKDVQAAVELIVALKPYVEAGETIVKVAALAKTLYEVAQRVRQSGVLAKIALERPDQPELNLGGVRSAEEIATWLHRMSR